MLENCEIVLQYCEIVLQYCEIVLKYLILCRCQAFMDQLVENKPDIVKRETVATTIVSKQGQGGG